MAHFILICERRGPAGGGRKTGRDGDDREAAATDRDRRAREAGNGTRADETGGRRGALEQCARLLWPPGVTPAPTKLVDEGGLSLAVISPNEGVALHGTSLCLGTILDTPGEWWRPGSAPPDGSYALIRCSTDEVEIVADIAASRTVWYYHDDDVFLASSSQRALVALLGEFQLEPTAVTWMVAAGSLGPLPSYDRRLRRVPPDGTLRLDRRAWRLESRSHWEPYEPEERSDAEHVRRLAEALVETCAYIAPDAGRWPILLSGGSDSRTILMGLLQAGAKPRCVTWGLAASLQDDRTDPGVARRVAQTVGVPHEFFSLDACPTGATEALTRFVTLSEGQLPDFTGYMDGFATWETLVAQGCVGVVRGDNHGWGYLGEFTSDLDVRRHCGADLVSDYAPGHPIHRLGLPPSPFPEVLERQTGEDLLGYRDRLQHSFFIPAHISPLNQPKATYLEIVNPLQARRVADVVARLPERLRLHPGVLALVLGPHGPDAMPFADREEGALQRFLACAEMRHALADVLRFGTARSLFDAATLDGIAQLLVSPPRLVGKAQARKALRAMVPQKLRKLATPMTGTRLDARMMAFRMVLAARAVEVFEEASRAARASASSAPRVASAAR